MSDSRFHLKAKFEIYGQSFEWDPSLNWSAHDGGCDERITNWFISCHDAARLKFCEATAAADENRRTQHEEQLERAQLSRLRQKYPDQKD